MNGGPVALSPLNSRVHLIVVSSPQLFMSWSLLRAIHTMVTSSFDFGKTGQGKESKCGGVWCVSLTNVMLAVWHWPMLGLMKI
jgi:hypothetical protein